MVKFMMNGECYSTVQKFEVDKNIFMVIRADPAYTQNAQAA